MERTDTINAGSLCLLTSIIMIGAGLVSASFEKKLQPRIKSVKVIQTADVPNHFPDAPDENSSHLILVNVKAFVLKKVGEKLENKLKNHFVVLFQNGIGILNEFETFTKDCCVIRGVVLYGVGKDGENHGDHTIGLAPAKNCTPSVIQEIKQIFKESGFRVQLYESVDKMEWDKALTNILLNGPTAVTNLLVGEYFEVQAFKEFAKGLIKEAIQCANTFEGIFYEEDEVMEKLEAKIGIIPQHSTSMREDMWSTTARERNTECKWLYGYVLEVANKNRIDVPYTKFMIELIQAAANPIIAGKKIIEFVENTKELDC